MVINVYNMLSYIDTLHFQKTFKISRFQGIRPNRYRPNLLIVTISLIYDDVINVLFKILLAKKCMMHLCARVLLPTKDRFFALHICRIGKSN